MDNNRRPQQGQGAWLPAPSYPPPSPSAAAVDHRLYGVEGEPDYRDARSVILEEDEDDFLPDGSRRSCADRIARRLFHGDLKVALYAVGLLVASTGNSIMIKKMTNKMSNYPYFLNQLTTFVYLPIFFGIVAWEYRFTNDITPEMTKFPKRKFLVMGLFDALSGLCVLFGGIHTSGSFQALLNNAVIPFTMALSMLILGTRYLKSQHAGAMVILAGVSLVMIPLMVEGGNAVNNTLFNCIYLMSTVPQALSSIYKEIAFGDFDLDVNYLQAWVAFFQFVLGFVLAPVNSLPFLEDVYTPLDRVGDTLSNGARCFVGRNTVVNMTIFDPSGVAVRGTCWSDDLHKWGAPSNSHCDECSQAWLPTLGYIFFNCMYNLFIVLVIKYGNAALLWIILTVRLPLVQIAFAISAIQDPPDPFKPTSVLGMCIILAGLILYRYASILGTSGQDMGPALEYVPEEAEREREASRSERSYNSHHHRRRDSDPSLRPYEDARGMLQPVGE